MIESLPKDIQEKVREWLSDPYDAATQSEVQSLLKEDPNKAIDAFYKTVSFGTGGMRSTMGVGTNRLNIYTIRFATQGLANTIKGQNPKTPKVFIGYDSRNNSPLFAKETARVLAGNGIEVFITKNMRPTPYVSFGCRHHGCTAAVMITASHNPPEYNGYKVYWEDGAQVTSPHDTSIMNEVSKITHPKDVMLAPFDSPLIHEVEDDDDNAYLDALEPLVLDPETSKKFGKSLHIIYSPLHGCGTFTLVPALKKFGFTNIEMVNEQEIPDGNFPHAPSPNPESESALDMGIDYLLRQNGDIFFATDPDADRLGVVVNHHGSTHILNGNQIASLCLYYLCNKASYPENSAAVTTIVTTELFLEIASSFNIAYFEVLTGFKYIGEKIHEWEKSHAQTFLFGAEESLGFLYGTHARDKDATAAALLISQMALDLKQNRKTLIDYLNEIYEKYGPFLEKQRSIPFGGGKEGMEKMNRVMKSLRESPLTEVSGDEVIEVIDYLEDQTNLPKSNVLLFHLKDKSKFVIRPSGTEPKIKIYGLCRHNKKEKLEASLNFLENRLKQV